MKFICLFLICTCLQVPGSFAQAKYDNWFSGVKLLRLEDGNRLEVNTGICAPLFRDMNRDGVDDMLVGEFGNIYCPGEDTTKSHPYVQGRCRVYWNYGTNENPVYRDFEWLESGGKPLFVPITCCVGLTPAFGDLDGDGIEELISGCYPGELYRWKMVEGIRFGEPEMICYTDGSPLNIGQASTAFPFDMDGDGNLDLVITGLYNGVFWARNAGDGRFEKAQPILNSATGKALKAGHAVMYDWDGDGRADLLYGAALGGNVYWCRNEGNMKFGAPALLVEVPEDREQSAVIGQEMACHGEKMRLCIYDYNRDGKPDLVMGTNHWEGLSQEASEQGFGNIMKDEEVVEAMQRESKLAGKMKRYTDVELAELNERPEGVPEKLFVEWKKASGKVIEIINRKMMEMQLAAGGVAGAFGCVWVYFGK